MTVLNSFKIKIFSLISQYLKSNSIELFSRSTSGKTLLNKGLVTVLSRDHFDESAHSFPIENKSELKKLIKLNHPSDLLFINPVTNGQRKVSFWQIKDTSSVNTPLIIPETWLLATVLEPNVIYEIANPGGLYFFAITNTGYFSSFKSPLMATPELFSDSCGIHFSKHERIDEQHLKDLLFRALCTTSPSDLVQFNPTTNITKKTNLNIKVALPAFALVITYYLFSSAYIFAKNYWIEDQLSTIQPQSNELLTLKNQLDADIKSLSMVNKLTANKLQTVDVWEMLYPLYEQEVKFTSIRIEGNKVYITAHAKSAVTALEQLNQNPHVKNAKFRGPQRTDRKGERFNLEFDYE